MADLVKIATRDAYGKALAELGREKADLIVFDLRDRAYLRPCHSMINNIVFSAMGTDVCLTMVDGKVLYRDGLYTTIDLERVVRNADASIQKILSQL